MKNRRHKPADSLEDIAHNALVQYGFTPFFDRAVTREVRGFQPARVNRKDGIKDLRDLLWSSIDNIDSEDLDQVEYCEQRRQGEIHVKIAIADVDQYVRRADAIDEHASHNATSLYTGVRTFPMLPEELSYHLTSLLPNEDRLAMVVEYNVKKDGQIRPGEIYQAWIRNKAKLVYERVGQWLEEPASEAFDALGPALKQQLLLQHEAAMRLKQWRQAQGMLEFESIEPKPVIENGEIKDLQERKANQASTIIEQFMVAANQTMIKFLSKNQVPTIQRIVRVPERWGRIVEIAQEYGFKLPADPDPLALRAFLVQRLKKAPDTFADLSLVIIKLIGRGEYEMVAPGKEGHGHFGLAVGYYTHSTAPNRRYVDLIIQRLVKAVLQGHPPPYTRRELVEYAAWCTERDTASKKLERFMRKAAAAMLLQEHVGEKFEGIVTGVSSYGVYARLLHPPAEGRIMKNERGLDVGQKVLLRLSYVDPSKGFIDFDCLKLLH